MWFCSEYYSLGSEERLVPQGESRSWTSFLYRHTLFERIREKLICRMMFQLNCAN